MQAKVVNVNSLVCFSVEECIKMVNVKSLNKRRKWMQWA